MKKKFRWVITVITICAVSLFGCGSQKFSGRIACPEMQQGSGSERYLLMQTEDEKVYQFLVTDDTQIVWKDKAASGLLELDFVTEDWDVLSRGGHIATVECGAKLEQEQLHELAAEVYEAKKIMVTDVNENCFELRALKPVIYLYPETQMDVSVFLDCEGTLTCTYPAYGDGWQVSATPEGILTDKQGQTYNYLYWEGDMDVNYDFSKGFCVKGKDTAAFLEEALEKAGLTRREANEFIVYWLPVMEDNPYNLIAFQKEAYTSHAELNINPAPDTQIRVFMAWKPLMEPVEIEPQEFDAPKREGFTVVEWGGTEVH